MLALDNLAYLIFGITLVILLAFIIKHYYKRSRHEQVEEAKFKMLDED
jgi:hypothetical protein